MRRALRRAWWGLAVACGVALVGPALAQTNTPMPPPPQLPAFPRQPGAADGKRPAALSHRAVEIQIELAWLTDPLTFPFPLHAQATESGVEVHGCVTSAAVRDRAIKIAAQRTPLPVSDQVKVQTSLEKTSEKPDASGSAKRYKAEVLQAMVIQQLKTACGREASAVQVACNDVGLVQLTGTVASREEQLTIAQQLQHVPGCACVVSQERVPGANEESVVAPPAASPPSSVPKLSATSPNSVPVPAPWSSAKTTPAVPPAPTSKDVAAPAPLPALPSLANSNVQPLPPPSQAAKIPTPDPVPPSATLPVRPVAPLPPIVPSTAASPRTNVKAAPTGPAPLVLGDPYVTTGVVLISDPEPIAVPTPKATAPQAPAAVQKAPALPTPPVVPSVSALPEQKVVVVSTLTSTPTPTLATTAPTPLPALAPVPTAPKMPTVPVTTAPVQAQKAPNVPAPPPAAIPASVVAGLKAAVERTCGPRIRDVAVVPQTGKIVLIRFAAQNSEEATQFWNRIQAMPELQAYDVNVEVRLPR
jgi:hypothetical protein